MGGPVPKRSEERRRRNQEGGAVEKVDLAQLVAQDVEVPVGDLEWHPIAYEWYESLKKSGQSLFYEPSDWTQAVMLAETLSRELEPQPILVQDSDDESHIEWVRQPIKGASLTAILKGMTELMTTEGGRRRLKIELNRQAAKDAMAEDGGKVVSIVQNRSSLFK